MKGLLRLTMWTVLLGCVPAGVWATLGRLFQDGDRVCVGELLWEIERGRQLSEEKRRVTQRIVAKWNVARDVVDGRLTLLQAAAGFRAIDSQASEINWQMFRATYPGANDDERHCREVVVAVAGYLDCCPGAGSPDLVDRLGAELEELIARRGTVALPQLTGKCATVAMAVYENRLFAFFSG